jgi:hypothetical protein
MKLAPLQGAGVCAAAGGHQPTRRPPLTRGVARTRVPALTPGRQWRPDGPAAALTLCPVVTRQGAPAHWHRPGRGAAQQPGNPDGPGGAGWRAGVLAGDAKPLGRGACAAMRLQRLRVTCVPRVWLSLSRTGHCRQPRPAGCGW